MTNRTLRRNIAALGTTLGLGVALPFAVWVTPAYAQAQLEITKTTVGAFVRGGQGVYRIHVDNTGGDPTTGGTRVDDHFPTGITVEHVSVNGDVGCLIPVDRREITCGTTNPLAANDDYSIDVTVNVAADAPCSVTNTASVIDVDGIASDTSSVTTNIPGGGCSDAGAGGGGSILPVNLNGVIPMFNNITTNNNIQSPGAHNASNEVFGLNTP
ncbi:hypothetical protein [Streptomyces sp. NPDC001903]|uniref:hypothetical protein n=1 Tax=Streptomyces sp. NPDC001903 TaxID=3364622 RepID=UPI003690BD74